MAVDYKFIFTISTANKTDKTFPVTWHCNLADEIGKRLGSDWTRDWMNFLPDSWKINRISIPGTHNSATSPTEPTCWSSGLNICQCGHWTMSHVCACQECNIKEQLESGIRLLDIRPKYLKGYDELYLYHGSIHLGWLTFGNVIEIVTSFLMKHPSEVVFVMFKCTWITTSEEKEEYCGKGWREKYEHYISNNRGRVFPRDSHEKSQFSKRTPTLGEVRGRMVMITNHEDDPWDKITAFSNKKLIEDTHYFEWEEFDAYIRGNLNHIKKATDASFADGPSCERNAPDPLYLTYLSANRRTYLERIHTIAGKVNERIYTTLSQWIKWTGDRGTWGAILMDYPTAKLVELIIKQNHMIARFHHHKSN